MKKPKLSFGRNGFKGFLIQNVEKIVFGIAVLMVLVFIYLGFTIQSYDSSKTPDKLKSLATQAVAHINEPSADQIIKELTPREGRGGQYETRVMQQGAVTDATAYSITVPWDPPSGAPGSKREDPELYPPLQLETFALTAPLCVRPEEDETGPLEDLEDAPLRGKNRPRPKRKRRNRNQGGSGSYGDLGEGGDEGDYGEGMGSPMGSGGGMPFGSGGSMPGGMGGAVGTQPTTRYYPADKVCGYRPGGVSGGGMPGMPGSGGEYDDPLGGSGGEPMGSGGGEPMGSGGGMMGSGGGMMGSGGGMMGSGGGMMGSGGGSGTTGTGPGIAQARHIVIVKALAPYRKESDEYERVLGNAVGYQPMRDRPRIIFFQAQRADVTADPTKAPDETAWKAVTNPTHARQMMMNERWHGTMAEVADPRYVDPNVTMPIPPLMLRCLEDELVHSEIPKATQSRLMQMQTGDDKNDKTKEDKGSTSDFQDALPGAGMGMPGAGMGMPGMGMPGSGMGMPGMGMPGSGMGMPGMGMPGSGMGMPGTGYGDMGEEGLMDGGYGYGGYMGSAMPAETIQYKLVRFFDMSVKPGHVYRYRVRLFYDDPNNPNTDPKKGLVSMPPARRTLSGDVIKRLKKQQADDKTKEAYYVITDWSVPSDLVKLPSTSRLYIGPTSSERFASGTGGTKVPVGEPKATVAAVGWDEKYAIDVSAERPAYRGSMFNYKDEFDVLDPVSLAIKLLKDYQLQNNILVLDIQGGEDLPGDRKKKVVSAGELLMLDEAGNLVVHNELDDRKPFRFYTYADEPVQSTSSSGYGDMGEGGDMGSGPGMGMPGMSGPGGMGPPGRGRRGS